MHGETMKIAVLFRELAEL